MKTQSYKQASPRFENIAKFILSNINSVNLTYLTGTDNSHQAKITATCNYLVDFLPKIGHALRQKNGKIILFNGCYWQPIEEHDLKHFLKEAAIKMGMRKIFADNYKVQNELFNQIFASAFSHETDTSDKKTLINFQNGTLEISGDGVKPLRPFQDKDLLTYQLNFDYDPLAKAPIFEKFLNRVLPNKETQLLLSEFLGYSFIKNSQLKLEKVLMLFGTGHNGKSVVFDIVKNLVGKENFSSFSPQKLMNETTGGQYRAEIENKLLNFASECGTTINADMFKKMASGEPIDARPLYGKPYEIEQYAKLIFNANQLPQAPEMTSAYFRRYIIIPFKAEIAEHEKDVDLAKKISLSELPGVFNWVLFGLNNLLRNKCFTKSEECDDILKNYQKQSDSVQLFIEETTLSPTDNGDTYSLSGLYQYYRAFCYENGYRSVSSKKLSERLITCGFAKSRNSSGTLFNVLKNSNLRYEGSERKLNVVQAYLSKKTKV